MYRDDVRLKLFHVSERNDINVFEPRMPPSSNAVIDQPVVWAVCDDRLANYLFPRDCPRICMRSGPKTTKLDRERFLGTNDRSAVIVTEKSWYQVASDAQLFLYQLPPASFLCVDDNAGYYVSNESITPLGVQFLSDPLQKLAESKVEVRTSEDLRTLAAEVAASSIAFSIIRLRNARAATIAT